jgi:hypothetical protein
VGSRAAGGRRRGGHGAAGWRAAEGIRAARRAEDRRRHRGRYRGCRRPVARRAAAAVGRAGPGAEGHDATERRITESYGKASDQLGSDKAPVRFAGLYAIERLAGGCEEHRQTIVNVLCAYLRMPFENKPADAEELQVRKTAQRILLHLRPGSAEEPNTGFWPDVDLDFSGATLVGLTLTHCSIRSITCYAAKFSNWHLSGVPNSAPRPTSARRSRRPRRFPRNRFRWRAQLVQRRRFRRSGRFWDEVRRSARRRQGREGHPDDR